MSTVKVPTIDKRRRIPQKAIDQVVEQIVEKFKPQKIILFGSYAYGKPTRDSDVDLMVIVSNGPTLQKELEIRQAIDARFQSTFW